MQSKLMTKLFRPYSKSKISLTWKNFSKVLFSSQICF